MRTALSHSSGCTRRHEGPREVGLFMADGDALPRSVLRTTHTHTHTRAQTKRHRLIAEKSAKHPQQRAGGGGVAGARDTTQRAAVECTRVYTHADVVSLGRASAAAGQQ